jgi:hypothetical protein
MYIHIGNKRIVSDMKIIGIFNANTLNMSKTNSFFLAGCGPDDKTVIISDKNELYFGNVSSFTVIKRIGLDNYVWRKVNG